MEQNTNNLTPDLIEAREIIAAITSMKDSIYFRQLTPSDERFIAGWQSYLARKGDQAKVGRWRLKTLRRIAADYYIEAEERVTLDFSDVEREIENLRAAQPKRGASNLKRKRPVKAARFGVVAKTHRSQNNPVEAKAQMCLWDE